MDHKELLEQKLEEISSIIENKYSSENDIGIIAGIAGCSLFQFYYSKYLDVDQYADKGVEMIFHCVDKINNGYSYPTYCNGIAGLGWAIQHLNAEDFIDLDCDGLLAQFDEYLYSQMKFDLSQGNYDFLHGALGYGFYFLKRFKHTTNQKLKESYEQYLLVLIEELDALAISEGNALKWESTLDIEKGTKGFNLSLSHGMSSILDFLSRLHSFDVFKESSEKLILGCVNYILNFQNDDIDNISVFPSWIEEVSPLEYKSRIAWCYGDLGVGLSLMRASAALDDPNLKQRALKILNRSTNIKEANETLVLDAGVCHGSYGNAHIFNSLYHQNRNYKFKDALNFWIEDGIKKAIHEDGYAGYKQWTSAEKTWKPELSLLEGVAGIGLTIIDYLSKEPNRWDECLMIS